MLEIKDLYFQVADDNQKEIIRGLNLTIDDDKFVVITGPNGGGKSTLAKLIAGIIPVSEGKILFNGEDITLESFKAKLIERLSTADIKQVKEDVLPFVRNPKELDIWSNDYFVQLADMVIIE